MSAFRLSARRPGWRDVEKSPILRFLPHARRPRDSPLRADSELSVSSAEQPPPPPPLPSPPLSPLQPQHFSLEEPIIDETNTTDALSESVGDGIHAVPPSSTESSSPNVYASARISSHQIKPQKSSIPIGYQLLTIFGTWSAPMLLFIPAGFAVKYTHQNAAVIFAINFVAIFPTILILSFAAGELELRMGERPGELINATFSNAAQFITSILLLRDNQISLLQITLVGNILSSMHLMLGISFSVGGMNRIRQHYNLTLTSVFANLLLLSMVGLILPTMGRQLSNITDDHILRISRGISFIFLFAYAMYLFFSLWTHIDLYMAPSQREPKRNRFQRQANEDTGSDVDFMPHGRISSEKGSASTSNSPDDYEDEDREQPSLFFTATLVCLIVCTTLITFNTAFATDNLEDLFEQTGISETFVGIVLLPLLSNDVTVIVPAIQDKTDHVVALTVGKCLQTILVVIPFTVLLGWILRKDMSLSFDEFEVVALFASVLYINSIITTGKSTYLDGVMLSCVFLIICLVSFWVP